ncbi:hypothetical protein ABU16_3679 [Bacillus subtilis]|nr:hypothetical protein ABU16_3679 [Bacillus subtilis]
MYELDKGVTILSLNKARGFLYTLARILGDVQAASKGTFGKRIARRAAGIATNTLMRKIIK